MGTEEMLELVKSERESGDELSVRGAIKKERLSDGKLKLNVGFEGFGFEVIKDGMGGLCSRYAIVNPATGEKYDCLTGLAGVDLEVSSYPFGHYNHEKKRAVVPEPTTRGRLLSGLHEIEHASQYKNISDEQRVALGDGYAAIKQGIASDEQKVLIIDHEESDWSMVRVWIKEIEDRLGVKLVTDKQAVDRFVQRRLDCYRGA